MYVFRSLGSSVARSCFLSLFLSFAIDVFRYVGPLFLSLVRSFFPSLLISLLGSFVMAVFIS